MSKYLYNGVELPALPEWDRDTYPNVCITMKDAPHAYKTIYHVFVSSTPFHVMPGDSVATYGDYYLGDLTEAVYFEWSTDKADTMIWENKGIYKTDNRIVYNADVPDTYALVWTNTDILDTSGKVYLSASDPIPVNPAPTLDPTALLMGWQVGNRIRGGA